MEILDDMKNFEERLRCQEIHMHRAMKLINKLENKLKNVQCKDVEHKYTYEYFLGTCSAYRSTPFGTAVADITEMYYKEIKCFADLERIFFDKTSIVGVRDE